MIYRPNSLEITSSHDIQNLKKRFRHIFIYKTKTSLDWEIAIFNKSYRAGKGIYMDSVSEVDNLNVYYGRIIHPIEFKNNKPILNPHALVLLQSYYDHASVKRNNEYYYDYCSYQEYSGGYPCYSDNWRHKIRLPKAQYYTDEHQTLVEGNDDFDFRSEYSELQLKNYKNNLTPTVEQNTLSSYIDDNTQLYMLDKHASRDVEISDKIYENASYIARLFIGQLQIEASFHRLYGIHAIVDTLDGFYITHITPYSDENDRFIDKKQLQIILEDVYSGLRVMYDIVADSMSTNSPDHLRLHIHYTPIQVRVQAILKGFDCSENAINIGYSLHTFADDAVIESM